MKTAMQELIYELDFFKNILWKADSKNESILVKDIIRKAVLKLEKEKEQIIDAHFAGWEHAYNYYITEADSYSSEPIQAEDYYNETYTQKK
jgi:hypothetical protein